MKVELTGDVKVYGEVRDISRHVYQRLDIDWSRVDPETGLTNLQIAAKGNAPYLNDGTKVILHHLTQDEPGAIAEVSESMHQKYYRVLHGQKGKGESFRNDQVLDRQFNKFRDEYWKWRAKMIREGVK